MEYADKKYRYPMMANTSDGIAGMSRRLFFHLLFPLVFDFIRQRLAL